MHKNNKEFLCSVIGICVILSSLSLVTCEDNNPITEEQLIQRADNSGVNQLLQLLLQLNNPGQLDDGSVTSIGVQGDTNTNISPSSGITNIMNSIRKSQSTNTKITDSTVSTGNTLLDGFQRRALDVETVLSNIQGVETAATTVDLKNDSSIEFTPKFNLISALNSLSNTGGSGSKVSGPSITTGNLANQGKRTRRAVDFQSILDSYLKSLGTGSQGTTASSATVSKKRIGGSTNTFITPLTNMLNALNSISNRQTTSTDILDSNILSGIFPTPSSTSKVNIFADGQLGVQNLGGVVVQLLNKVSGLLNNLLPGLLPSLIGRNGLLTNLLGLGKGGGLLDGLLGPKGVVKGLLGSLLGPGGLLGGLLGGDGLLGGLLGGGGQGGLLGGLLGGGGQGGLLGGLLG